MNKITVPSRGNFGNKIMQYLAAKKIQKIIGLNSKIYGINIEELNIYSKYDQINCDHDYIISDENINEYDIKEASIRPGGTNFIMNGFFQDINLFPSKEESFEILNEYKSIKNFSEFSENDLVINVRCGDISIGVEWYPLIPLNFYKFIVDYTGLKPVFVGQLDNEIYVSEIKKMFPNARYIPSQGTIDDFSKLLTAKNILLSVSTFSWLAGWLSEAKQIFYPMHGFLNPALQNCYSVNIAKTNLAPTDDLRYRFFMLPLMYGEPLEIFLNNNALKKSPSFEIDRSTVKILRENAGRVLTSGGGTEGFVDNIWYVREYPDAAWEISYGWFSSPSDHYSRIGRSRGYFCHKQEYQNPKIIEKNFQFHVNQSSVSPWSVEQEDTQKDALRVMKASPWWIYANHTASENNPWWRVEFENPIFISGIVIYNRKENGITKNRLFPFEVYCRNDIGLSMKCDINNVEYINDGDVVVVNMEGCEFIKSVTIILPGEERILHIRKIDFLSA